MNWPTPVRDDGSAPTLMELLAAPSSVSLQAAYLARATAGLKDGGHEIQAVQVPLVSRGVRVTVPGVLTDRQGRKTLLYTNCEKWTPAHVADLERWIASVRRAGVPDDVGVVVVSPHESPDALGGRGLCQFMTL